MATPRIDSFVRLTEYLTKFHPEFLEEGEDVVDCTIMAMRSLRFQVNDYRSAKIFAAMDALQEEDLDTSSVSGSLSATLSNEPTDEEASQ